MKIKLSKTQWTEIGSKANWLKEAQIIPDDGYADGGEPYTDEEMDLIEGKPMQEVQGWDKDPNGLQQLIIKCVEEFAALRGYISKQNAERT